MSEIDRRDFLKSAGAGLAAATLGSRSTLAALAPSDGKMKKGFMLGVTEGPILPHFELLKSGRLRGRRAHQSQQARSRRSIESPRQDGARHSRSLGLEALGFSALRPKPRRRGYGNQSDQAGVRRRQGLRRHHGPPGPGGRQQEGQLRAGVVEVAREHSQAFARC